MRASRLPVTGCLPDTVTYKQNKFYWGLLAIDPQEAYITDPALSKYTKEILFASKHGVPAEYLIGFLMQSETLWCIRMRLARASSTENSCIFAKERDPQAREAHVASGGCWVVANARSQSTGMPVRR